MYYFDLLFLIACAVTYYRIGEMEYGKGFLVGAISVLIWSGTSFGLGWGWLPCLGAQLVLFVILTIINMFRKPGFK